MNKIRAGRRLRRLEDSVERLRARVDRLGGWLMVAACALGGAAVAVLFATLAVLSS